MTREVDVKNIILISMLLFLQSACTIQSTKPVEAGSMLNFVDLAAEISVNHEITESTAALDDDESGHSTD